MNQLTVYKKIKRYSFKLKLQKIGAPHWLAYFLAEIAPLSWLPEVEKE